MDSKKERSSRQRLKVDIGRGAKDDDGTLLLANPMAGGEVSSPRTPTSSHSDHVPSKAAPWKKGGQKSPSILRFFVRGSTSSRKASEDVEDSLSCDHDDGLSSHSQCSLPDDPLSWSPSDSSFRFNRNLTVYATMPRRSWRVEKRDSGFHSERSDSTSQDKEPLSVSPEDLRPSPAEERPVGMEALEALHNQIQILVKQDCPEEETQLTSLHDAVIASLRHQVDDMQQTLEFLRTSDHNLRLALRDAEQRAHEAEVKLAKAAERAHRLENKLVKYQHLVAKERQSNVLAPKEFSHHQQKADGYYSPQVQRSVRQTVVTSASGGVAAGPVRQRPSSAQGTRDSLSSIETCV